MTIAVKKWLELSATEQLRMRSDLLIQITIVPNNDHSIAKPLQLSSRLRISCGLSRLIVH
jgi:hypothetical protein